MAVGAGPRPGFWLQHSRNNANEQVALLGDLTNSPAGRPGMSFGPLNAPTTLNPLFAQVRTAGDAILDPHGLLLDRDHTETRRTHFPWLTENPRPSTQAEWEAWMQAALDHQNSSALRGAGPPSFVMTPSPILQVAHGDNELYAVTDAAAAVRGRQSAGVDCWLSITVERDYLRTEPHLTKLANAVVSNGATGVVFRAEHSEVPPVTDARYLNGFREVVQALAGSDIRVFLPYAGWLGWLAMGWGAWGFSGGMPGGSWGDRKPSVMNAPDLPSEYYFEPQLLRPVRWRHHEELRQVSGYQPCSCDDCQTMASQGYDAVPAARHQVRWANQEGESLVAVGAAVRQRRVASRLDQAITFRDSLSPELQEHVEAAFLDRWRALV
jgi:hypothetical protein